ncbi:Flp pilus assembly protein CpaB [Pseudahrensia aquimaris]|uniref:Flp pilus assembly protein CpaB n=1 Tax=Pseudahrensia aquimaris TaxID=744461 RepID=A0ABW3FEY1_9HYPH
MKPMQMIVLGIALIAAVGLAFVARNMMAPSAAPVVVASNAPVQSIPTVDVLVANEAIPMGSSLTEERLAWEEWPQTSLRDSFITRESDPEALETYAKQIARSSFFEGEPIRQQKLVQSESGYLSAILPAGKRAASVRIQAETSAGGFILPNDRVDVIMSYKDNQDRWMTNTILTNVRVLAIDQLVEEKDGEKFQIGETATLELSAYQAEVLTVSKAASSNQLTLVLRSVADSNPSLSGTSKTDLGSKEEEVGSTVRMIRGGDSSDVRTKK